MLQLLLLPSSCMAQASGSLKSVKFLDLMRIHEYFKASKESIYIYYIFMSLALPETKSNRKK